MEQSGFGAVRARSSNMAICANAAPLHRSSLFLCAIDGFFLRRNSIAQTRLVIGLRQCCAIDFGSMEHLF